MLKLMRSLLKLNLLLLLALSGCNTVTVKDTVECTADGLLSLGFICTHTETNQDAVLSTNEAVDFLEAQPARLCVPVPGFNVCSDNQDGMPVALPARGAAVCMSADDWSEKTMELEEACRDLGDKCSVALQTTIASMKAYINKHD